VGKLFTQRQYQQSSLRARMGQCSWTVKDDLVCSVGTCRMFLCW